MKKTLIPGSTRALVNECLLTVDKYDSEWHDLMAKIIHDPSCSRLRKVALLGEMKNSRFRSIIWALFLDVFEGDSAAGWVDQRKRDRMSYQKLKEDLYLNPQDLSTIKGNDNPLSQTEQSAWNQYFCDQGLNEVIRQDVIRTFPNLEFFRRQSIQDMMCNVLFCYAREYPQMCYRQGMHEILGPLIYVIYCDYKAMAHIREINPSLNYNIQEILNIDYLEEDSYALFKPIMKNMRSYYHVNNVMLTPSGYFPEATSSSETESNNATKPTNGGHELEVVNHLNIIRDAILQKHDIHLHNHLLKLDIQLPLFGIRWLRLLFGREFNLDSLLIIWDAIFAVNDDFRFVDFLFVAMMIRVRDLLLIEDYTNCLTLLMRYPSSKVDILLIIRHALHMYDPSHYELPHGAFVRVLRKVGKNIDEYKKNGSSSKSRTQQNAKNSVSFEAPKTSQQMNDNRVRSSSMSRKDLIQKHVMNLQHSAARATFEIVNQFERTTKPQSDNGVRDGYTENSVEDLCRKLQNAHTTMNISRMKLLQYLAVLQNHIPVRNVDEVQIALDGIEEICAFLEVKEPSPYKIPAPVEKACEANEKCDKNPNNPNDTISVVRNRRSWSTRYETPEENDLNPIQGLLLELGEVQSKVPKSNDEIMSIPSEDPIGERQE